MYQYRGEEFDLYNRAFKVLDLIAAEFESDPMSTQCFDLRIVNEIKTIVKERKQQERLGEMPPLLTEGKKPRTL